MYDKGAEEAGIARLSDKLYFPALVFRLQHAFPEAFTGDLMELLPVFTQSTFVGAGKESQTPVFNRAWINGNEEGDLVGILVLPIVVVLMMMND